MKRKLGAHQYNGAKYALFSVAVAFYLGNYFKVISQQSVSPLPHYHTRKTSPLLDSIRHDASSNDTNINVCGEDVNNSSLSIVVRALNGQRSTV